MLLNFPHHLCYPSLIAGTLLFWTSTASAVEIAPSRYLFGTRVPNAHLPFVANHSPTESSRTITRLVLSIHSSSFDAIQYFENARAAATAQGVMAETLIIAPQFFEQTAIPCEIPNGMLFWRVSPFRGSSRGAVGPDVRAVRISAFDVIDHWLSTLTHRRLFPKLKNIVLVGHSGGGQLVQRYAMVGKFEPNPKIKIRFVVSAPSSYAYPSAERLDQSKNRFLVPDASTVAQCPKYNDWGYGLNSPYGYFERIRPEVIASRYPKRNVFYLCGSKDSDPNDAAIGKSCGAMLQGRHRLERMQVFSAFLESKYGPSIRKSHKFSIVPGMGHYGKGTMNSKQGLAALFSPIR